MPRAMARFLQRHPRVNRRSKGKDEHDDRNRRAFLAAAATATMAALCAGMGGCNTIEGVGQDIEKAGDAIEDKAREEKRRN